MKEKEIKIFCDAVIEANAKTTAKILKKRHANPNACTAHMPILIYTILNRHAPIAAQLIAHPMINLNQRAGSKDKSAAMHYAVSWLPNFVEKMLERQADPNIQDAKGNTPLHHAAQQAFNFSDEMPALRALLADHRTDVLIKNNQGETAYDVASDLAKKELDKHPYVKKFILQTQTSRQQGFNSKAESKPAKAISQHKPSRGSKLKL